MTIEKQIREAFARYLGREPGADDLDKAFTFTCGFMAGFEASASGAETPKTLGHPPRPFKVTLTGADNRIDPADLRALSLRFPWVEWGILFGPGQEGTPRFPDKAWRAQLVALPEMELSAHLCGRALKYFADEDPELWEELSAFSRIQLNFNAKRLKVPSREALRDAVAKMAMCRPQTRIILQHNSANVSLAEEYAGLPNVQILFDSSGGTGVIPKSWPDPLPGFTCGFAGGLTPENVGEVAKLLTEKTPLPDIWLDMESGVRTNNAFDLRKCEQVLALFQ